MSRWVVPVPIENWAAFLTIMNKERFDRNFKLQDVIMPCIYFLFNKGAVVYVGKTEYGLKRILCHTSDKDFDEIKVKLFPSSLLDEKETHYIAKYNPKYNQSLPNAYSSKRIKQLLLLNHRVRVRRHQVEKWIDGNVSANYFFKGEKYIGKDDFNDCINYFISKNQDGNDI